jgi:hypothetical protein
MPTIDFKVTGSVAVYWVAVDNGDVKLVNGRGQKTVPSGSHRLLWWAQGNTGDTLTIVGSVGGAAVMTVNDVIPKSDPHAAGTRLFRV